MRLAKPRSGFTLIELLVVVAIISTLMGLLLPAVQKVREAANRMRCLNNLKQIGLALHNYESGYRCFPASIDFNVASHTWSIHAHILPYIEENALYRKVDFTQNYTAQVDVTKQRIAIYMCPSEERDEERLDGSIIWYPTNYGFNLGSWQVYNPGLGVGGDGVFFPVKKNPADESAGFVRGGHITDGLSYTLGAAEVKAYTPYMRQTDYPSMADASPPAAPEDIAAYWNMGAAGKQFKEDSGHTEWVDGRAHQTGFTTTFRPNTVVPYTHTDGITYNVDYNSRREGTSAASITYAAITSRSYHAGQVNVLLMDGSARPFGNEIALDIWRALGTRAGSEIIPKTALDQ